MKPFKSSFSIIIFGLANLFLLYEMGIQVSPSVMAFQLMLDFEIGAGMLGLMSAVYFYSYAAMQIPAGMLFDRYGPRVLISLATVTCAVGALLFGSTYHMVPASLGRLLMGFGSAFAFIGVLTVAFRWFHPRHFALLVGIAQFLAAVGALGGALPLAQLLKRLDWRTIMIAIATIGFILAALCAFIIRDFPLGQQVKAPRRYDMYRELKEIIKNLQTWWLALYAFCSWGPIVIFATLWGVPYLNERYQVSSTEAAAACSMIWIGIALTAPFIGWLSDWLLKRRPILIICAALGLLSSLILFYSQVPYWGVFFLLFGFGVAGAGQILTFAVVKDINRPSITSTAIGVNNMAVVAGGAILQPLVGWILYLSWHGEIVEGVPSYSTGDYLYALTLIPLCYAGALISSLFLIEETNAVPSYMPGEQLAEEKVICSLRLDP